MDVCDTSGGVGKELFISDFSLHWLFSGVGQSLIWASHHTTVPLVHSVVLSRGTSVSVSARFVVVILLHYHRFG